jgi:hypothetical protein
MLVNAAGMTAATSDSESWLIADIGATSSRCATLSPPSSNPQNVRIYRNEDFPHLSNLLADFLDTCEMKPQSLALAVAASIATGRSVARRYQASWDSRNRKSSTISMLLLTPCPVSTTTRAAKSAAPRNIAVATWRCWVRAAASACLRGLAVIPAARR